MNTSVSSEITDTACPTFQNLLNDDVVGFLMVSILVMSCFDLLTRNFNWSGLSPSNDQFVTLGTLNMKQSIADQFTEDDANQLLFVFHTS